MKAVDRLIRPAVILGGLLAVLPMASLADKGGKPNESSVATTAACLETEDSVHVYSCKALSNVVIWCDGTYIKHDDIGLDPETGAEEEIFDAIFDCGDAAGPITFVAIKSGSQKHNKQNSDYTPPLGLPEDPPSGSGLFVGDIPICPLTNTSIPLPGECVVEPTEPPLN
jgi:hypothetical protein